MINEGLPGCENEQPATPSVEFTGRKESEKLEMGTASRLERKSIKKKNKSKHSSERKLASSSNGSSRGAIIDDSCEQKKRKKKKKDKKKRHSNHSQRSSTLFEHEPDTAGVMGESPAAASISNASASRCYYDSSGSMYYEHSPKLEQPETMKTEMNRLLPPSSLLSASPPALEQQSALQQTQQIPKKGIYMNEESEDLSVASDEDESGAVVLLRTPRTPHTPVVPPPRPIVSSNDNNGGDEGRHPVSASNLFSSSVTHTMQSTFRGSPRNSPILARKTLMDDLASFAEASLGTSVGGDTSDTLSLGGSIMSNVNQNPDRHLAISSTDAVTHELLVSYMLSMGAPRGNAESLAFAFMSQQNLTQRAASTPNMSSVSSSPTLMTDIPRSSLRLAALGLSSSNSQRSVTTHKIEYIRGAAASRPADGARSIRDDIGRQSVHSVSSSQRRPRHYVRADGPGAVEMEGRAFGAPLRLADTEDDNGNLASITENSSTPNLVVQALPIEEGEEPPMVYADSSPLSIKFLLQKGPIRTVVLVGIVLLATAIGIICYFLLAEGASENDNYLSPLDDLGTLAPSSAPTLVSDEILSVAKSISGTVALDDPNSPQFQAVGWLSTFDEVQPEGYGIIFVQRYILATFFFSTNGENWLEKEKWLNPRLHACDWSSGIFCKIDITNHLVVNGIDLTRNGLSGALPDELGLLSDLKFLSLSKNTIAGKIPAPIYELQELTLLDVGSNRLNGLLPLNVGKAKELTSLVLSNNKLSGLLPPSLWDLSLLQFLDLSSNQLSGRITDNLTRLVKLVTLNLKNNLFSGEFPRDVEKMEKLDFLWLDYNELTGSLPPLEAGFVMTQEISFSHNLLTGSLPELDPTAVVSIINSVRLSRLDISHNFISGTINAAVSFLPTLRSFDVSDNLFTNEFPARSGWGSIESLAAADNFFTGTISTGWPAKLRHFDMSGNLLNGTIPSVLCKLPNLEFLMLSGNELDGTIPSCIANLDKLRAMEISDAGLNGPIPDGIDQLRDLTILNLSKNALTGQLPSTLTRLKLLNQLHVNGNWLSGCIPSDLDKLTFLRQLHLDHNAFVGSIPSTFAALTILESFSVAGNALTGSVPEGLCQLAAIKLTAEDIGCDVECGCCQDDNDVCG